MNDLMAQQNVLGDLDALDRIEKFANLMADARITIPPELQKNPGDCLALCLQAQAWGMNPFAVAQKAHVIKGKLGYEAQLVNAVITRHAPIERRPVFTWSEGWDRIIGKFKKVPGKNGSGEYAVPNWSEKDEDGLWCEVSATIHGEDAPRVLRLNMRQAHPRQSTLWATDPKQQIAYTVMKRWARLHTPDVVLGIYTPDEVHAMVEPGEKDVTPSDKLDAVLQGEPLSVRKESDTPAGRTETGQYIEDKQEHTYSVDTAAADVVVDKGEAMKQRVRKNMWDNGQMVDSEPTDQDKVNFDMAIECINASRDMAQLEEAGKTLEGVLHPDYQGEARKAYRHMQTFLTEQAGKES